jgi:hypothetical protein
MKHPAQADWPNLLTLTPAQKAAKAINWSNPVLITAAEEEARAARSLAMRMDFANWKMMQDGLESDALRCDYPPGYEVGSFLPESLDPVAVAAYVYSYSA